MRYFGLTFFLISIAVFASDTVKLDMKLQLHGKDSHPQIITKYGNTATVAEQDSSGRGFEITVTPEENTANKSKDRIVSMNFVITELTGTQKQIIASPRVTVQLGKKAQLTLDETTHQAVTLEVTPSESL